ncbi:lysophospholipid acyltransferase family protein [Stenotrophomonas sp. SY1]|jgi:1-acyl-sn-glycerol-3-phosphate acyltransferase|uniref:lysophospholipid acyltransferase family protein n=1 Tax=Stenotrophomonas sp. SY1 TaxID=477235 RepID=UPI001E520E35|nr:lysophospholipid acyltransferase family protein [Stenotrophomonas sp. SY1]MCD9085517.1 lysophospholipid acyltransferase family protein [Stenotrophomonas sp. SY1]
MPQVRGGAFTRWLGRSILRLGGWHIRGPIPDLAKAVVIAAPHSSNWDGLWGLAAKMALGLEARILGKDKLFWWPLSTVLRRLGVVPLDRSSPQGTVGQAVEMIRTSERVWYALAPEGTRKPVKEWKGGFLKIARMAEVPVIPAYFHYPDRVIGFGPPFHTSGDDAADMAAIRQWYRQWMGRNRGTG